MTAAILGFVGGAIVYLAIDIAASRLAGEERMSLPTAALVVGLITGVAAHYLGPWLALAVFVVIALTRVNEAMRDRASRASRQPDDDGPA